MAAVGDWGMLLALQVAAEIFLVDSRRFPTILVVDRHLNT